MPRRSNRTTVARLVHAAVIRPQPIWSFAQATKCAETHAGRVASIIKHLIEKDPNHPDDFRAQVFHVSGNRFHVTVPPSTPWPPFYFDDDQHNQDVILNGENVIIEIADTAGALRDMYLQVYENYDFGDLPPRQEVAAPKPLSYRELQAMCMQHKPRSGPCNAKAVVLQAQLKNLGLL